MHAFSIFDDASEILYESSRITVNQTLAILFSWFCSYPGVSKEAFSSLFFLLHNFILPPTNKLPESYTAARSAIKHLIAPLEEFDCCVNDCVIFRNSSNENLLSASNCPKCGENRYEPFTQVPRKKFKYIPLAPRLKRMFANKKISELLQDHQNDQSVNKQTISDIATPVYCLERKICCHWTISCMVMHVEYPWHFAQMAQIHFRRKKLVIPCGQLCSRC